MLLSWLRASFLCPLDTKRNYRSFLPFVLASFVLFNILRFSLNYWQRKFVLKVAKKTREKYPPKRPETPLYGIVLKRTWARKACKSYVFGDRI